MQILVKNSDKKPFFLDVKGSDTIQVVKEKIEEIKGIESQLQTLSFQGEYCAQFVTYFYCCLSLFSLLFQKKSLTTLGVFLSTVSRKAQQSTLKVENMNFWN